MQIAANVKFERAGERRFDGGELRSSIVEQRMTMTRREQCARDKNWKIGGASGAEIPVVDAPAEIVRFVRLAGVPVRRRRDTKVAKARRQPQLLSPGQARDIARAIERDMPAAKVQ